MSLCLKVILAYIVRPIMAIRQPSLPGMASVETPTGCGGTRWRSSLRSMMEKMKMEVTVCHWLSLSDAIPFSSVRPSHYSLPASSQAALRDALPGLADRCLYVPGARQPTILVGSACTSQTLPCGC